MRKTYNVEYLSIFGSNESFCNSVASFNNLLQSYDSIIIEGKKILFNDQSFKYDIQFGVNYKRTQRFFHTTFHCGAGKSLEDFNKLLKSVRTILTKACDVSPEVLWDDRGSELATAAYPIIHKVENMMRKLITKFMLTNIGLAWTKDAVPKEVSESINTKKSTLGQNYLYEADFIQLSNFLFKEYATASSKNLITKLQQAKKLTDLDLNELKEMVPTSNWERYFSPIVECKSGYLQTRWEKLYKLRCLVAHNKFINKNQFDDLSNLSREMQDILTQALEKLDQIKVPEDDKEDVAENIAVNMSEVYKTFIICWNEIFVLLEYIVHIYSYNNADSLNIEGNSLQISSLKPIVEKLVSERVISKKIATMIIDLSDVRNTLVHSKLRIKGLAIYESYDLFDEIKEELVMKAKELENKLDI